MSILKHIRAVLLLPVMVTVVIPTILIYWTGRVNVGWSMVLPFNLLPIIFGLVLICLGLALMVRTIRLFATTGRGTLAPWDPTEKLVVRDVYRHVRNPMISGVFCVLLGEAVVLGAPPVLYWFVMFVIVNAIYMPLVEERGLLRRFGEEYKAYKRHVPRWMPRLRPWNGELSDEGGVSRQVWDSHRYQS